jgi:hypothetical protein
VSLIDVVRATPPELRRCRARECARLIEWVTTTNGKRMPIDAPLVVESVHERLDGATLTTIDTKYSHFATCPAASQFRKARA